MLTSATWTVSPTRVAGWHWYVGDTSQNTEVQHLTECEYAYSRDAATGDWHVRLRETTQAMTRKSEAIVKAGAQDRAQSHLKEAMLHLKVAWTELQSHDPENAVLIGRIWLPLDEVMRRLA